jgi:hypothetical protein
MTRIEALALALAHANNWMEPDSLAFSLMNPGLLKAFKLSQTMDANQHRVFESVLNGFQALLYDLETKCSGRSRSKLKPTSAITDLLAVYSQSNPGAVLKFLRKALNVSITDKTPLSFFLE